MKIYLNKTKENWVVDRLSSEWKQYNQDLTTRFKFNADLIWVISPWMYEKRDYKKLANKKTVLSIYHIDEEKFGDEEMELFKYRDQFVDFYHVISQNTKLQVKKITNKPIYSIPFWINQNIFFNIENKYNIRKEFNFNEKDYIIGSFQRDSEGSALFSPKLSKGPDRFVEIVKKLKEKNPNLRVLLTGKRRNYLIEQLNKNNIPFYYFEMVNFETLNKLYNSLDLYIVSSRYEGGPQAIMECAVTKTPIISTNVGVAPEILSSSSIYEMKNFEEAEVDLEFAFNSVKDFTIPFGFKKFIEMFTELYEN